MVHEMHATQTENKAPMAILRVPIIKSP